jgi:isopenicillin-N epimerase
MSHPFPPEIPGARDAWTLDPTVTFLNHGSFGATPRPVLEAQTELRARIEREPVLFLGRQLEPLLDQARERVARFLGADAEGLSFVSNATAGVNAVLRSLVLRPGDEILVTNHGYNACNNAARFVAERSGGSVSVAQIPWPIASEEQVIESVLASVTARTRVAVIDHVTSPTGAVLPIAAIVVALSERGVETIVDGAHAPAMLALEVPKIGAAWYTGNLHKWCCAPKGAAFLWTHPERRGTTFPLSISHGFNMPTETRDRHRLLFDWTGTDDPTPWLCAPHSIDFVGSLLPGGWPALRERGRALALAGRDLLAQAVGAEPPTPDSMVGFLAAVPLPSESESARIKVVPHKPHPLHLRLWEKYRIEVPVTPSPGGGCNVRISAAPYNRESDYRALAAALRSERL